MVDVIEQTKAWIQAFVIGLNLCPFAKKPFSQGKIRYILEEGMDKEAFAKKVIEEAIFLSTASIELVETSIIIHPNILNNFEDYLDTVDLLEYLLEQINLEGVIQIATFHPNYQFDGTAIDAVENFTNRSPFPMIHLLREDVIEIALENYPNPEEIPVLNVQKMLELGWEGIKKMKK